MIGGNFSCKKYLVLFRSDLLKSLYYAMINDFILTF